MTLPTRIFTWRPPPEGLDPRIVPLTRVKTGAHDGDPDATADSVCDLILERGLKDSADIAITLQNFGMGGEHEHNPDGNKKPALFAHPDDSIPAEHATEGVERWKTPYTANGIRAAREWTALFIRRYQSRQRTDGVPAPSAFDFDTERVVPKAWGGTHKQWYAIIKDPRYSREPVDGLSTLYEVYSRAGYPTPQPQKSIWHPYNDRWRGWYQGLAQDVAEWAFFDSTWRLLRDAFPDVRYSNYGTSVPFKRSMGQSGRILTSPVATMANVLSPVLYGVKKWTAQSVTEMDEKRWNTLKLIDCVDKLRRCRDVIIKPIVPWIMMPWQRHPKDGFGTTPETTSEIMDIGKRYFGIKQWLVWGDQETMNDATNWGVLDHIVRNVYGKE